MKIIRKIQPIEVKRAFVAAQKIRLSRKKKQRYLPKLERKEFLKKLTVAKRTAGKLSEKQLDRIIAKEYQKRMLSYNNSDWYLTLVSPREAGVWRRAGGLPASWTCGSLAETAQYFRVENKRSNKRIHARAKRAIPRIMEFADIISREGSLFPIGFQSGTGTRGRRWCRGRVKVDIDDGCMRAIALVLAGKKTLKIYFGKPKKR